MTHEDKLLLLSLIFCVGMVLTAVTVARIVPAAVNALEAF